MDRGTNKKKPGPKNGPPSREQFRLRVPTIPSLISALDRDPVRAALPLRSYGGYGRSRRSVVFRRRSSCLRARRTSRQGKKVERFSPEPIGLLHAPAWISGFESACSRRSQRELWPDNRAPALGRRAPAAC